MKKKIAYIAFTAAISLTAFFIGRNTIEPEIITVERETVKETIPENYVYMKNVVDFTATDDRFQLYFNDGTGFYWGP